MKFFVYVDIDHYPDAEIVEADTAQEAGQGLLDKHSYTDVAVAVVPADQVEFFGEQWRIDQLHGEA